MVDIQPTTCIPLRQSFGATDTIGCIFDAMLLEFGVRQLTHELLVTLISEVAAIVNARPITALQSDIDEPLSGNVSH